VFAGDSANTTITVGNGNDTIHVGPNSTVNVGTGHDQFIFDQTTGFGAVTATGFDPNKDVIQLTKQLVPSQNVLPATSDGSGGSIITVDAGGDTIHLVGVAPTALHASDFLFV
jgi:Ca2+-binding RTX toxin-like protein